MANANGVVVTVLLNGDELYKYYGRTSQSNGVDARVRPLDGVSVELTLGETLGVVGESGSGKTTLAKLLVGRERPTAGTIQFHELDLSDRYEASTS